MRCSFTAEPRGKYFTVHLHKDHPSTSRLLRAEVPAFSSFLDNHQHMLTVLMQSPCCPWLLSLLIQPTRPKNLPKQERPGGAGVLDLLALSLELDLLAPVEAQESILSGWEKWPSSTGNCNCAPLDLKTHPCSWPIFSSRSLSGSSKASRAFVCKAGLCCANSPQRMFFLSFASFWFKRQLGLWCLVTAEQRYFLNL